MKDALSFFGFLIFLFLLFLVFSPRWTGETVRYIHDEFMTGVSAEKAQVRP